MNRNSLAALAFVALATPALAQTSAAPAPTKVASKAATPKVKEPDPTPEPGNAFLARISSGIETRSLLNCDDTLDPTHRNAARGALLSLPRESAKVDPQLGTTTFTEIIPSIGVVNNANYSACFTSALKDAPEAAVLYNGGSTRMIALNPSLSDADTERALVAAYAAIKAGWNLVNEGKLKRDDFEKPQGIVLDAAKPSATLPAEAPHKYFRLLREIDSRSAENCNPERDAKEADGHRILNIGLPHLHAAFANQPQIMGLLEAVNSGKYSVCFDKTLRESDDLAVIYNGKARIIALKPNPSGLDFQQVLHLAYTKVQNDAISLAAGKITPEVFDTPQGIRTNNDPAPAIKTPAPHRNAALQ